MLCMGVVNLFQMYAYYTILEEEFKSKEGIDTIKSVGLTKAREVENMNNKGNVDPLELNPIYTVAKTNTSGIPLTGSPKTMTRRFT